MASRRKDKTPEIDPELLMKKKFKAKCRFRALVRLAMANAYWLLEYSDSYQGDDVKKRIDQAVRGKKGKQLLTIDDKALLNKPAADRTEQEKKYIYRKIGGFKCFKRYPNHVKRKLAAATYFKYFGPNRVIIRENQEAQAMYFMVTGKVTISHKVYDGLLEKWVSVVMGTKMAGDMFGDVSLLHNIPRSATVTTTDHCELLVLGKADFKTVLQVSIQKQWDEVREAMDMFTYFKDLDDVARREGCIVAKMKKFQPDEIILGDGHGIPNHVYFIINGRCQMIEMIKCFVTRHVGHTYYSLYDPYKPKKESEEDLDKKYSNFGRVESASQASINKNITSRSKGKSIQFKRKPSSGNPLTEYDLALSTSSQNFVTRNSFDDYDDDYDDDGSYHQALLPREMTKSRINVNRSDSTLRRINSLRKTESRHGSSTLHRLKTDSGLHIFEEERSNNFKVDEEDIEFLETFFMQVLEYSEGSTFGFGENMRDRRIVARTPMLCLLIPKVWLLQHNTANIWTRIEYYLNKKIPQKKKLFKELVNQLNWEDYRNMLVKDVVANSKAINFTSVHDVPYSIRLEELLEL